MERGSEREHFSTTSNLYAVDQEICTVSAYSLPTQLSPIRSQEYKESKKSIKLEGLHPSNTIH